MNRRQFIKLSIAASIGAISSQWAAPIRSFAALPKPIPTRSLGATKKRVTILGFGGEGVLRTWGHEKEAVPLIQKAIDLGINYFDTAPAYSGSQDYYGAALGERRKDIFLASKTHDRTRDGSLKLLDKSLARIRTDRLDLWQLHDLRDQADLDRIFARDGAIEAIKEAKKEGRVKYVGLTGHHNPEVLVEAMRRFHFDTVLIALNAVDRTRLSFIEKVIPAAKARGTGIIGMKVIAKGRLIKPYGPLSLTQAIGYVMSHPISTAIIGFSNLLELTQAVKIARDFHPYTFAEMDEIEKLALPVAANASYFKQPASTYYSLPNAES